MRVLDVMTANVVTVTPDDTLKEAARRMINFGVSGLPVVDEEDHVIGIITEADFLEAEANRGRDRNRRLLDALFHRPEAVRSAETVGEAMTRHPVVIEADAPLVVAAREMAERGVKRLPVIDDDGVLMGIISRADIVSTFVRPDDVIEDEIREDVIRRILLLGDDDIDVTVTEGVVNLSGEVPTKTDARLVEELSARLEGVVRVESELTWQIDDTKQGDIPLSFA